MGDIIFVIISLLGVVFLALIASFLVKSLKRK